MLRPPQIEEVLTSTHNLCFREKIRKNNVYRYPRIDMLGVQYRFNCKISTHLTEEYFSPDGRGGGGGGGGGFGN